MKQQKTELTPQHPHTKEDDMATEASEVAFERLASSSFATTGSGAVALGAQIEDASRFPEPIPEETEVPEKSPDPGLPNDGDGDSGSDVPPWVNG